MWSPDNEWNKLRVVKESLNNIVESIKNTKMKLPNYIFVVGINDDEVDIPCHKEADIIVLNKGNNGESVIDAIKTTRGNILNIIVGGDIKDMTIDEFTRRVGEVLSKKIVIVKNNLQTTKLLRELVVPDKNDNKKL